MERVLANKTNYLVAHGYEVVIVTTDQRGKRPFFHLDGRIVCYDLGINYEENNGKPFFNKLLHYPVKQWRHRKRLAALLMRECPDICISMFCNDASFLPEIKDGSKKMLEAHFSRFKRLQYARRGVWRVADLWRSQADARIVRHFDKFVVLTEEDKGYWGISLPNICVIPNACTFKPTKFASLHGHQVLAVGRLTFQKGYDHLLAVWQMIHTKFPDWHLCIIGDGDLREDLQRMVEKDGLQESVSILAETDNISDYYLDSSVFALTSRYEGLPMVLLEAQSYGLPIVAFRCKCGPADVVTDGVDGFLVAEGDERAFADRLQTVMESEEWRLRMGASARNASARYSEENIMQKWECLFHSLLEG